MPPIQTKDEESLKICRFAEGREWRGEGEEIKRIRAEKEERVMKEMVGPRTQRTGGRISHTGIGVRSVLSQWEGMRTTGGM